MEVGTPGTVSIETLFDISEPYVYVLVLPVLTLAAIGLQREAALFAFGAFALLALFSWS
jgi:hypothetical protein